MVEIDLLDCARNGRVRRRGAGVDPATDWCPETVLAVAEREYVEGRAWGTRLRELLELAFGFEFVHRRREG